MVDGYRIDYENLDVEDLVAQIRARVQRGQTEVAETPAALEERIRARLRTYLVLDERRPYELQAALALEGDWNVSPEDLRSSGRRGAGRLVAVSRSLFRPFLKLAANFELPLYKQFKTNLGMAAALRDLLRQMAELEARVHDLKARLDELEGKASSGGGRALAAGPSGPPDPPDPLDPTDQPDLAEPPRPDDAED